MRHQLGNDSEIVVESAGLSAMAGSPVDDLAESVLAAHGLTAISHVARQLEASLLERADIVLAMDKRQRAALLALAPRIRSRLALLGKWQGDFEIPDPYRKQRHVFEDAYLMIESAVTSWREQL